MRVMRPGTRPRDARHMPTTNFKTVHLERGKHRGPEDGSCEMELASIMAGAPCTDRPRSGWPTSSSRSARSPPCRPPAMGMTAPLPPRRPRRSLAGDPQAKEPVMPLAEFTFLNAVGAMFVFMFVAMFVVLFIFLFIDVFG